MHGIHKILCKETFKIMIPSPPLNTSTVLIYYLLFIGNERQQILDHNES